MTQPVRYTTVKEFWDEKSLPGRVNEHLRRLGKTINGDTSWNGILMVVGEGQLYRGGVGTGAVSGATVIADFHRPLPDRGGPVQGQHL